MSSDMSCSAPVRIISVLTCLDLDCMRGDNSQEQSGVSCVNFSVARSVTHLDSMALAANQASFAKNAHMLRQGGLRDRLVEQTHQMGAVAWAILIHGFDEQRHAHGFGERMQDHFERNVFNGWMDKRFHTIWLYITGSLGRN